MKIRNLLKKNIKVIIAFVIGLIISGSGVYAATVASSDVSYTNNSQSTVQGALDNLFKLTAEKYEIRQYCLDHHTSYLTCNSEVSNDCNQSPYYNGYIDSVINCIGQVFGKEPDVAANYSYDSTLVASKYWSKCLKLNPPSSIVTTFCNNTETGGGVGSCMSQWMSSQETIVKNCLKGKFEY